MDLDVEQEAVRLVVVLLRCRTRLSQRQIEALSGVDQRRWSRYELGQVTPRRSTLERLARVVGVTPMRLDQLLGVLRQIVEESGGTRSKMPRSADLEDSEPEAGPDLRRIAADIAEGLEPVLLEAAGDLEALALATEPPEPPLRPDQARRQAAVLWETIEGLPDRYRRLIVQEGPEYQTEAMFERICAASRAKAATDPAEATALAATARLAAELAPGPPALRDRWRSEALSETGICYWAEPEACSLRDEEDAP